MDYNLLFDLLEQHQLGTGKIIEIIGRDFTDDELEALIFAHKSGNVGIA